MSPQGQVAKPIIGWRLQTPRIITTKLFTIRHKNTFRRSRLFHETIMIKSDSLTSSPRFRKLSTSRMCGLETNLSTFLRSANTALVPYCGRLYSHVIPSVEKPPCFPAAFSLRDRPWAPRRGMSFRRNCCVRSMRGDE